MIFSDELLNDFNRDGYVVIHDALSQDQVAKLKQRVGILADQEQQAGRSHFYSQSGKLQRVWNLLSKGSIFSEVLDQELIITAMNKLFDRDTIHDKYYLSSFQANILLAGAEAQKWHLDTPIPEPHPSWIIKSNTIWLLDDFTEINGATEVIPGSHLIPHRPRTDHPLFLSGQKKVIAKAGSVIITHGALWHRSGHNQSDLSRTVLLGSFAASFAREIANEENMSRITSQDSYQRFSPNIQRMLGLDHGIKLGAIVDAQPSTREN